MKVTTSTPEKEFKPIVLTITIESKEELNHMFSKFNNCQNGRSGHKLISQEVNGDACIDVYHLLDKIITSRCGNP